MTTEAYKRGMEDFYDKTCHATQPYDAGTEDAIDWSRGYYTARHVCRMKTHVPRHAYAVIDPAWGDLRVMILSAVSTRNIPMVALSVECAFVRCVMTIFTVVRDMTDVSAMKTMILINGWLAHQRFMVE